MSILHKKYPLENIKPLKKTIASSFRMLIVLLVFLMAFIFFKFSNKKNIDLFQGSFLTILSYLVGFFVLLIIIRYIYEVFYLKYYHYDLIKKNLIIKKGVFSKNEITLPINKIQDVYVDQDILDRIFGLYDVHVSSATMISGNLSHIDGLNNKNADIIKKLILKEINKNG